MRWNPGKPIAQARGEIGGAVDIWRYAASLARTLHGESYANLGDAMPGVVVREPDRRRLDHHAVGISPS